MRTLILVFAICFGATAQDNIAAAYATNGYVNGRGWKIYDKDLKLVYLKAYIEAMTITRTELNVTSEAIKKGLDIPRAFIIADYVAELDRLYSDTINVRIPVAQLVPSVR